MTRLRKHGKQMLTTASPKINESEINYSVSESITRDIRDNEQLAININLSYKGDQVAYLMFTVNEQNRSLYIENIEVWDVYQGLGFAQYLYKKFGEIYREKFNGWIVERDFQSPAAEAAFNKAIEKGWVPPEAFNENYTRRSY